MMKQQLLKYKEYYASIDISLEDGCLYGKVEFINDSIVFGASTIQELEDRFHTEVDEYLEFCAEIGKSPDKASTGTFNIRIGQQLHKKALIKSKQEGVSLNDVVKCAVEQYVNPTNHVHNHVNVSIEHKIEKTAVETTTQTFDLTPSKQWTTSGIEHGTH